MAPDMDKPHAIASYDFVNHPYELVRDALLSNPSYVFRHATAAAAIHDAALRARIAGVDIGKEVRIEVLGVEEDTTYGPVTFVSLRWRAAHKASLFPTMVASLAVFSAAPDETQLAFNGTYDPPLGRVGDLLDDAFGHRIAETTVDRFVKEVAAWLREELTSRAASRMSLASVG